MESLSLIPIIYILHLTVLLSVGFLTTRRTPAVEDYFLGGRRGGPWLAAVSSTAA